MPIYTYLIVQGFFHTKNFNKYILRMGVWAAITQLCITAVMIVNLKYVPMYTAANFVYENLNILFAYAISLGLLKILHEDLLIKKWDYNKNLSLKIICILLIMITVIFLPMDYNIEAPMLAVLFYVVERLKISLMINTESFRARISKLTNKYNDRLIHGIYTMLLFVVLLIVIIYFNVHIYSLFAIIPIALYNGERGKNTKLLKNIFYFSFPIHNLLLYSLAILIMLT